MLRFAAAVLAVAAITPTPAEKGLARLSEALASPAVVNNDVLWTRCGALDKMAPHSTMQLHSHSVKCQDGRTGATASNRRSRFDRAESVAAAGTADAAVVNHCFMQIDTVTLQALGRARVRHHLRPVPPVQPAVGRSGASHRRQLATGGRRSGSAASGGRCDGSWPRVHSAWLRVCRVLSCIASRPVAVSDRASPGAPRRLALVSPSLRLPQQLGVGEDGDGAGELGLR